MFMTKGKKRVRKGRILHDSNCVALSKTKNSADCKKTGGCQGVGAGWGGARRQSTEESQGVDLGDALMTGRPHLFVQTHGANNPESGPSCSPQTWGGGSVAQVQMAGRCGGVGAGGIPLNCAPTRKLL